MTIVIKEIVVRMYSNGQNASKNTHTEKVPPLNSLVTIDTEKDTLEKKNSLHKNER